MAYALAGVGRVGCGWRHEHHAYQLRPMQIGTQSASDLWLRFPHTLTGAGIWGGGVFFYDTFYDAADELGIMIYHDLMYIEQGHGPCCPFYGAASGWSNAGHAYNVSCECTGDAADTQHAELLHQMRRLSAHPSIVVWDACNECGGFGRYADFVMTTVPVLVN